MSTTMPKMSELGGKTAVADPTNEDQPVPETPNPAKAEATVSEEILSRTPAEKAAARSDALAIARKAKSDALFLGKTFTIISEINLEQGQVFETPYGNKGRHGYLLEEVGNADNRFVLGRSTLEAAARDYPGAVTVPSKRGRGKKGEEVVDPTS